MMTYVDNKLGTMRIIETDGKISALLFQEDLKDTSSYEMKETPLLLRALSQLKEYFAGRRTDFDLPLLFEEGTLFQRQAWEALLKIPYGKTISYSEQAAWLNRPKAVRAVGAANGKNPLPIFVPCHRVIGKNGHLTGYAGGCHIKQTLLDLEKNAI
jgi:methylated-DNA-[protein]-cysteine S-methyltransferase